jgi:hypothetical protein
LLLPDPYVLKPDDEAWSVPIQIPVDTPWVFSVTRELWEPSINVFELYIFCISVLVKSVADVSGGEIMMNVWDIVMGNSEYALGLVQASK